MCRQSPAHSGNASVSARLGGDQTPPLCPGCDPGGIGELLWAVSVAELLLEGAGEQGEMLWCCLEHFGAELAVPGAAQGASRHQPPAPVPRVIHAGAPALTILLPARSCYILLLPFCRKIMDFFFLYGMCKEFRGGPWLSFA